MRYIFALAAIGLPILTNAQTASGIFRFLNLITDVVRGLVPVVIGIAVLVFIWGILKYVVAKDKSEQDEARNVIVSGVVILFVMVSIWGLVNLLGETLQLDTSAPPLPAVPGI
jgi:peptidoglycan biosynthesis protein MviN/MurJ (putative lipid II flippase)